MVNHLQFYREKLKIKLRFFKIKVFGREKLIKRVKRKNEKLRAKIARNHNFQKFLQWEFGQNPEWMDHFIDLYSTWGHNAENSFWVERGCFNLLALKSDGYFLELCCGDGFNSKYFYSERAKRIISVDFDKTAIAHAAKFNKRDNIDFQLCDIRHDMPQGSFDNIIWDAAIEHFKIDEINKILSNIKNRLKPSGIFSGYTIVEKEIGLSHDLHEYEFKSKEDLFNLLNRSNLFKNILVFETFHKERHNLYFFCSDEEIPFGKTWKKKISNT